MKLGKKTGIIGIVLGALGFGGGTVFETATAPETEVVRVENTEALEELEGAVTELGSIITSGRVITGEIRERASEVMGAAKERAVTTTASVREQAALTREELEAEVQASFQRLVATAASGLAGIAGTILAALGFRDQRRPRLNREGTS